MLTNVWQFYENYNEKLVKALQTIRQQHSVGRQEILQGRYAPQLLDLIAEAIEKACEAGQADAAQQESGASAANGGAPGGESADGGRVAAGGARADENDGERTAPLLTDKAKLRRELRHWLLVWLMRRSTTLSGEQMALNESTDASGSRNALRADPGQVSLAFGRLMAAVDIVPHGTSALEFDLLGMASPQSTHDLSLIDCVDKQSLAAVADSKQLMCTRCGRRAMKESKLSDGEGALLWHRAWESCCPGLLRFALCTVPDQTHAHAHTHARSVLWRLADAGTR